MLHHVTVENIALLERLELAFNPGLTVITGETGAGKSILIDALSLALGARAEGGLMRNGAKRASVTAEFTPTPAARAWLAERELAADGEENLILRRTLSADGPSRAFINQSPVPAASLKELGTLLVDIHGQHDHQSLLAPAGHLTILDAFGGHAKAAAQVAERHATWKATRQALEELRIRERESAERRAFLAFQLEELEAAAVEPGEEEELASQRARLAHAARLTETAQRGADDLLEAPGNAVDNLNGVASALERAVEFDPTLAELAQAVRSAQYEAQDAAERLRHYRDGLDADPGRLETLEERLNQIRSLSRKHHRKADELQALEEAWRAELTALDSLEEDETRLAAQLARDEAAFRKAGEALSRKRKTAAQRLTKGVEKELTDLCMKGTRFKAAFHPLTGEPDPRGLERVAFEVSANPGEPPQPLANVASGGEISRIMLALKGILADAVTVPVLIFDEVDVGVGGRAASAIGTKLARAAAARQVLAITHQPQVAAFGGTHLQVEKRKKNNRAAVQLQALDKNARVEEMARMLAGAKVTEPARQNARELLEAATTH